MELIARLKRCQGEVAAVGVQAFNLQSQRRRIMVSIAMTSDLPGQTAGRLQSGRLERLQLTAEGWKMVSEIRAAGALLQLPRAPRRH